MQLGILSGIPKAYAKRKGEAKPPLKSLTAVDVSIIEQF